MTEAIRPKDLREGDYVELKLRGTFVRLDSDGDRHFKFDGATYSKWLSLDQLSQAEITRLSPPIRVGDRVLHADLSCATVKAIDGDEAWIRADDEDGNITVSLAYLTRINGESA